MSDDDKLVPVTVEVSHTYVIWVDPGEWKEDWDPSSWQMAAAITDTGEAYEYIPGTGKVGDPCAPGIWDYSFRAVEPYELAEYCEHRLLKSEPCQPCTQRESAAFAERRRATAAAAAAATS